MRTRPPTTFPTRIVEGWRINFAAHTQMREQLAHPSAIDLKLKLITYRHVVYRPCQIWGRFWFSCRTIGPQAVANIESSPMIVYLHDWPMFWCFWKNRVRKLLVEIRCTGTLNTLSHIGWRFEFSGIKQYILLQLLSEYSLKFVFFTS